jgi:hypothetical protein
MKTKFLELLKNEKLSVSSGKLRSLNDKQVHWIILRGLKLKHIQLFEKNFVDVDIKFIKLKLTGIESLQIYQCIDSYLPENFLLNIFKMMPKLTFLLLDGVESSTRDFVTKIPNKILKQLKTLCIVGKRTDQCYHDRHFGLSVHSVKYLAENCRDLENLEITIWDTFFLTENIWIKLFKNNKKLKTVIAFPTIRNAKFGDVTDLFLNALSQCKELVSFWPLTDKSSALLPNIFSWNAIANLINSCKFLKEFEINNTQLNIQYRNGYYVLNKIEHSLYFSNCTVENGFLNFLKSVTKTNKLDRIAIFRITNFDDECLSIIANNLSNSIEVIEIYNNDNLSTFTEIGLNTLLTNCKSLQNFTFNHSSLTTQQLADSFAIPTNLTRLNLGYCVNLTTEIVIKIMQFNPQLTLFRVWFDIKGPRTFDEDIIRNYIETNKLTVSFDMWFCT